jgi:hypothetical protein
MQAITILAEQATTVAEAARRVGMDRTALSKALSRPHIKAVLEAKKEAFAQEVDNLRETARKRAIIVGIELMGENQPPTVRARMVEFFAGEAKKAAQTNVTVQTMIQPGYAYVRPGEHVFAVATDVTSVGQGEKAD